MSGKAAIVVILILLLAGGAAAYYFFVMKGGGGGTLPEEALALPADTSMLVGVDVKQLVASVRKLLDGNLAGVPLPPEAVAELPKAKGEMEKGLKELEEKTGIRLDQDVDQAVIGGSGFGRGAESSGVIVVVGRFDRNKIAAAIEKGWKDEGQSPTVKDHAGAKLLVSGTNAAAVVSERVLVFGTPASVEATVTNLSQKTKSLNAGLVDLARRVRGGATFWLVAGEAMMSAASRDAGAMPIPMPKSIILSDHASGGIEAIAQMDSADAAKNAATMLKGLLEMAKAQGSDAPAAMKDIKPEITSSGSELRMTVQLPGAMAGSGAAIVAAVAIPNLLKARASANEAAAIGDMRTIVSAQAVFQSNTPSRIEFGELRCLSEPKTCLPDYTGPTFLDPSLSSLADKSGYKRSFFAGQAGTTPGTIQGYAYTAVPLQPGKTGNRSFCIDDSGMICVNADGSPFDAQGGRCPQPCTPLP